MRTVTCYRPLLVAATVACTAAVLVPLASAQPRRVKLSGAEVQQELLSGYSAFATVNHELGCVSLIVTHSATRRDQYWDCVTTKGVWNGSARVDANQLCSKWEGLGADRQERCTDVIRTANERYELFEGIVELIRIK